MFHCYYTCDVCQRVLDPDEDVRYVLRIGPGAETDGGDAKSRVDEDRDYLEEISEQLEGADGFEEPSHEDSLEEPVEYDLCSECRKRFSLRPSESRVASALDFSEN